jgi:branched-chain amino acid transport system substrate-binding protein
MKKACIWGLLLTIIFTVVFWGCDKKPAKEVKIGMIVPLTGSAAEFGQNERNAGLILQDKINAKGGISGGKLKLVIEDSQSEPKGGINAIQKMLLSDKPIGVFTDLSSVALSIAPTAQEKKIIMVSIAANPDLTNANKYAFRDFPTADRLAKEMATYVYKKLDVKKTAIFYINDDFGIGHNNSFKSEFTKIGGTITSSETFDPDGSDFRAEVTKILSGSPEGVYTIGYGKPLGFAIKQLREMGFKGKIMSGLEVSFSDVLTIAKNAADGTVYLDIAFDPRSNDPTVKEFVTEYRKRFGKDPSMVAALGYDGLSLLTDAISKVGDDPDKIREYLLKVTDYRGVCGTLSIQSNRDIIHPLAMKEIKKGESILVK